jgi:drug/metabolite transporter (DMT)-like permease
MVLFGSAYVPSAWLVEAWPPLLAAGARLGLAGAVLLGGLALAGRPLGPGVGVRTVALLALFQTVLFYGATYYGIASDGAGVAAVLSNTDPLFVALLAALVLGERLSARQWTGLGVGLLGAGVVAWTGPLWPPALSVSALVVVGGAFGWALGTVIAARGVRGRARPLALAGWQMLAGGAALAAAGLVLEGAPERTGAREVALIAELAVLGSAAPLALFYLALGRGAAGEVSAWFFLVPVVGVLTAWPLLGEEPTARLAIGMVCVVASLALVLGLPVARRGGRVASGP